MSKDYRAKVFKPGGSLAHALAAGPTLITDNGSNFGDIPDRRIEDRSR